MKKNLLLGPPGSCKVTMLLALVEKPVSNIKVSSLWVVQYCSQVYDVHRYSYREILFSLFILTSNLQFYIVE